MLRSHTQEHTLLKLEDRYELVPYDRTEAPDEISAYLFEYNGKAYATIWHKTGEAKLSLAIESISYNDELIGNPLPTEKKDSRTVITVSDKAYISGASREELAKAIKDSFII